MVRTLKFGLCLVSLKENITKSENNHLFMVNCSILNRFEGFGLATRYP